MRVIKPLEVTDPTLTSSTIGEPDMGETVWVPYTSVVGDRRTSVVTHRVYEAVVASADDPVDGVNATPPTWVDVAPVNKWAMFDTVNSTQSTETTQLVVEITPSEAFSAVAGFNVTGASSINITVTSASDGVVFNKDITMIDNSAVVDAYTYFWSPFVIITEFAVLDIPPYNDATVKITVDGSNIGFGNFIVGNQIELGVANYGTSVQLLDFSRKETDEFGNTVVVKGRNSKLVDFDVTILKSRVNYVYGVVQSLTTIPSVWIGDDGTNDPTLVFGYSRDYQNNISTPTITDATIQIEGLV